ncbi:hypothetical protein SDRG_13468 [Saprolegnia diclina VS20]|uniref:Uncharacterized protein n=1 Tax=Saprolegnia diclina (strain VS20) TaxID=1156394 RepID=T0Q5S0_SAPDV|nr:hypothetical protein SDRG_13468 [Saprolegnia diclina VS20]EQC28785.1 hypothetical protein SDRG_13468 [Saprolegnia diclina VS20]|eukprot:XP_008617780.1 hypothetical protein SDRG_13468 [Saprolegnia diclina VS20]
MEWADVALEVNQKFATDKCSGAKKPTKDTISLIVRRLVQAASILCDEAEQQKHKRGPWKQKSRIDVASGQEPSVADMVAQTAQESMATTVEKGPALQRCSPGTDCNTIDRHCGVNKQREADNCVKVQKATHRNVYGPVECAVQAAVKHREV